MYQVNDCTSAFLLVKDDFNPFCEEFWVLTLDTQLHLINKTLLSRGTLNFCLVHPRDLFRQAVCDNAYNLIIAHNHPSLNTLPTLTDLKMTEKLIQISGLIEIPIIDHIIFTKDQYFSFKKSGLIKDY